MTAASDLVAAGFVAKGGAFCAPVGSAVTVALAGDFFLIEIALPTGAAAICTVHMSALKVSAASPTSR
jgi:hypothetical protein